MEKTIIFSQLSRSVAELTQCTDSDAETFLRELFALASEMLEESGEVTIPGVGRFVVTEETVGFAPDAELAATLNAPFASFTAVELPDEEPESSDEAPEETVIEAAEISEDKSARQFVESEPEPEKFEDSQPIPLQPSVGRDSVEQEDDNEEPLTTDPPVRHRNYDWLWWSALCVLCFGCGWIVGGGADSYFSLPKSTFVEAETAKPDEVTESEEFTDSLAPVVAEPIQEEAEVQETVVTDTISSTRYLTTMARKHYGQMDYWVYIYEANADKLGHPDRLNGGTVVVIPSAQSLGLRAGDSAKIREAELKAKEIYNRFN